jgi:hypothetical protein
MAEILPWREIPTRVLLVWGGRYQYHMTKANEAARTWEARREQLREYHMAKGYTVAQARDAVAGDWQLEDAMGQWSWHEREAKRFMEAILAEEAMRRMMPL